MICLPSTHHAQMRLRQRGFRYEDALLVVIWGTEVREGVYRMTDKDADEAMADTECLCQKRKIYASRGLEVVTCDGVLITAYFAKARLGQNPRSDRRRRRRAASQRTYRASWRSS